MSISKWKELAAEKAKTGKMKQNLFDEITAEKIRSKTTDQAIAKTFRLDRLDQIAEQTKPKAKRQVRFQIPRINRDGGLDYAPEVDPYEDMDAEGLLRGCPCKNRLLDFRPKIEFLQIFCARQLVHMINKISKNLVSGAIFQYFWRRFPRTVKSD